MSPREPDPIARAAIAEAHLERVALALNLPATADPTDVTLELLRRQRRTEALEAQVRERDDLIAALEGAGDELRALLLEEQRARHAAANRLITAELRAEKVEQERAACLWLVVLYQRHLKRFRSRLHLLRERLRATEVLAETWRVKALELATEVRDGAP